MAEIICPDYFLAVFFFAAGFLAAGFLAATFFTTFFSRQVFSQPALPFSQPLFSSAQRPLSLAVWDLCFPLVLRSRSVRRSRSRIPHPQ
ncbi:MAG: hypothetical protein MZV70_25470 [Desulfobacterales bacterium]|nr:hypothetical protein [Desulfobacterales bacterium]